MPIWRDIWARAYNAFMGTDSTTRKQPGTRKRQGRSDIWLIGGVTIGLLFATVMVVIRLVDQTDAHVKSVSTTRVKFDQKKSPSLNEVERQIARDLKSNPNGTKASYSGLPLTKRCFKYIGKMRSLDNVDLADATFENEWLAEISHLPLNKLTVSGTSLNDEGLKHIGKITTLQRLIMSQTHCTDDGIKEILPLKSLQLLNVRDTKVSDASMDIFTQLPSLWLLDIADTKITAAGIQQLPKMKTLVELYVSSTPLTVAQIRPLKECKMLNFLQFDNCSIGDAEVKELSTFPRIKKLQLFTNKFTAAGLKSMANAKNVTLFKFTNDTKIPEAAISELRKARPDCVIEVKGAIHELMLKI